ncbi:[Pyruvate dehydrogenase (acetyl-transferring)] kinase, mitochondrial [Fragariocoptes setiger]|uniref:Protein-serine/threonine kinase n=1 Tax=Fragariocoptes setiger TaxID=1670756 RepID=A0ABQ7S7P8_9ACAR|nr:[Pyruvate dehydrogenase (acetyl-transferring)] kinase, mitochondrial [Fragariocoptes setiger]
MRISRALFADVSVLLDYYSRFNPSPLSIKKFLDFGQKGCERQSYAFLRKELPVRLANIMKEFSLLPAPLLHMPSVMTVQNWYLRSFEEILTFEKIRIDDKKTLENFCETLIKIRNRHSNVVQTMARGVIELKDTETIHAQTEHSIQYFLHRFYLNRISIRMLINQHAALFGADLPGHPRHIGTIDPNCDVTSVVQDAYDNAKFLCDQYYMRSPELIVETFNVDKSGGPISIVYVPSHLYHMAFELLKNAMRAVVEQHSDSDEFPPIKLLLVKGREDLSIKISDMGGGISRSLTENLFHYMYSTAPKPQTDSQTAPLAGYGYGLPLSRLYARYLQGDLMVASVEGYGTDAIIYLKVLSNEANEVLPVFNKTSSKHYRTHVGSHDYSTGGTTVNQFSQPFPISTFPVRSAGS